MRDRRERVRDMREREKGGKTKKEKKGLLPPTVQGQARGLPWPRRRRPRRDRRRRPEGPPTRRERGEEEKKRRKRRKKEELN